MTTTKQYTLAQALTQANINDLAQALAKVDLGNFFTPISEDTGTIAGTATITLSQPALVIWSLTVVTAAAMQAAVGGRIVIDATGTPSTTAATISNDGKTITLEAQATRVITKYLPRSKSDPTKSFN